MSKGGAPEGGQGQENTGQNLLWIMGLIIVIVLLLWYFEKTYIAMVVFRIRYFEIAGIDIAFYYWTKAAVLVQVPLPIPSAQDLLSILPFMSSHYGQEVTFKSLMEISTVVGSYLRYPAAFILLILAAILYFGTAAQKFKNIFNVKDLRLLEQKNWPQIVPIVKTDLVKIDLDEGLWAMGMDPMRFCKKNELLREEIKDGKVVVSLRRGAAYRILSLQLGPRWLSAEALAPYLKALFGIFASRINGDKKSSDKAIAAIAASATFGKTVFHEALELFEKHKKSEAVQEITNLHGYVTTCLASMLNASREAGVLASSEFIWLKPMDRRMWFMLNDVGRPAAHAEIAGAFAHWLAEKKIGLALKVPMVEEAVRGLEIALSEVIYKPEKTKK